ncbi:N-acetylglucosamine-6-phosphate deacetylase [Mycoplasma procyoni]|uniref:N-acetylglucosamine-6-phosphate deacetylase n=1 Tax=Mycoplasma procyoni TaxID=568784 RepID=UPI00280B4431|nr:N-acetylglucosamine-6-phosphate deacetylase [Mycoplasma procyoni]
MIIKNVTIINPERTINNADIFVENNTIMDIKEKEGQGDFYLVPGFIDTHIHGIYNMDVMDGTAELSKISKKLAKLGTTSFMPTAMTNDWEILKNSLSKMAKNKKWYSRNLGFHLEGPFISTEKKGAHKTEFLKQANKTNLNQLIKASESNLKKLSFDPKMVSLKMLKEIQDKEIIASIGHSAVDLKTAQKYFANGCYSICHLWNAMSGIDSRNPGLLQAALMDQNSYVEMIFDLVHISEQTIKFTTQIKDINKIIAVSDAIKPAYYKDGDSVSGGLEITKKAKLITLKNTKTIAGSGIVIHDAFINLVKIGYSLNDAIKICSTNSAKYLKLDNLGQIEKGFLADFVILDKNNLKIKEVYIDGKKVK